MLRSIGNFSVGSGKSVGVWWDIFAFLLALSDMADMFVILDSVQLEVFCEYLNENVSGCRKVANASEDSLTAMKKAACCIVVSDDDEHPLLLLTISLLLIMKILRLY